MAAHDTASRDAAGKYLTFRLAGEEYGLPVLKVREIITMMSITPVPNAPAHVKGILNLRGRVIPVVDLRARFGLAGGEHTEQTCVIVVDVLFGHRSATVGIVVDSVCEVLNVGASELDRAPDFGGHADTAYILGLAKVKGDVKILLDPDRVLADAAAVA